MAVQQNLQLARSLIDAFNNRDFAFYDSICSEQLDWIDVPTGMHFKGKEGIKQWAQEWTSAFNDGKIELLNVIASDDSVCVEYVGRGTQSGPLSGFGRTIPPSNRKAELHLCDIYQLKDGKIVSGRSYYDVITILKQVGIEGLKAA